MFRTNQAGTKIDTSRAVALSTAWNGRCQGEYDVENGARNRPNVLDDAPTFLAYFYFDHIASAT